MNASALDQYFSARHSAGLSLSYTVNH